MSIGGARSPFSTSELLFGNPNLCLSDSCKWDSKSLGRLVQKIQDPSTSTNSYKHRVNGSRTSQRVKRRTGESTRASVWTDCSVIDFVITIEYNRISGCSRAVFPPLHRPTLPSLKLIPLLHPSCQPSPPPATLAPSPAQVPLLLPLPTTTMATVECPKGTESIWVISSISACRQGISGVA